jgi:PhnB protein
MANKPVPEGYHSVTPYLVVSSPEKLLDFVKQAFGAEETVRMDGPDGAIAHAEVRIGDSMVMLGGAAASGQEMPATIYLYVDDTDATYLRAVEAGATSTEEPNDAFYGDRRAAVRDEVGNIWYIATNIETVSPEEMAKRVEALSQQSS